MALLFILVNLFLIFTSPPVLSTGDSGEFITDAYTLSIAHPPGYPLYCLAGKLFSLIGLSNPGWRVMYTSIFFTALTVLVLFLLIKRLTKNDIVSFFCSFLYACLQVTWSQSIFAKIYTINAFFTVLGLFLLILWNEDKKKTHLYLFSLVFGLSLTGHYPLILLSSPAFLIILLTNVRSITLKDCFISAMFFLSGLLVYLYLPIRSSLNPPSNWGDPHTLKAFLNHVLRQQYQLVELTKQVTSSEKLGFIINYGRELAAQFGLFILPMVYGAAIMFKRYRLYFFSFITLFVFNSIGLIMILHFNYNPERVSIVNVYYIPSYLICCVFTAFGLKKLFDHTIFFKAAFLAVLIYNFTLSFAYNNERNNFIAYDYGKNMVSYLKKGSVVFIQEAGDESLFSSLFVNKVMGKRADLKIYDCFGNVFANIYPPGFTMITDRGEWLRTRRTVERNIIEASPGPVYYYAFSDEENVSGYKLKKRGLAFEVEKNAAEQNELFDNSKMFQLYNLRGTYEKSYNEYQEREIVGLYYYLFGYYDKACSVAYDISWINNNAGLAYYRKGVYDKAELIFLDLLKVYPDYASAFYNLGLIYRATENSDKAVDYFKRYHKLNPSDPDAYKEIADTYFYDAAGLYKKNRVDEAIRTWEKAVKIKPDYSLAYYNMGIALVDLKRASEAKKYLERFIEIEPNGEKSKQVRAYLKNLN
jgi:tetratricopeptide (TPR) repeat protein